MSASKNMLYLVDASESSTRSVSVEKNHKCLDFDNVKLLILELNEIYNNSKSPNWDNEDAEPISFVAFQQALKFIDLLPEGSTLPEISPDNDGYIEFEWFVDPASISFYVTPTDVILFVVYYSIDNRFSGRFNLNDGIPSWLIKQIKGLLNASSA